MIKPNFNRPTLYVSLLSEQAMGVNGNHAVFSSNVIDEFTMRTPDALINGIATELYIQNCCPDLINPGKILLCDLQHLLASIKIASQGPTLSILLKCSKCNELDPYEIDLQQILPTLTANKWFTPLIIDEFQFSFRSPTYEEYTQFAIADFKISKQLNQISKHESPEDYNNLLDSLLAQKHKLHLNYQSLCVTEISNGKNITTNNNRFIKEWIDQCDIIIQKQLVEYISNAQKENHIADFSVNCSKCKNSFSVPIDFDISNQFRQKLIPASPEEILDIIKQMGEETKTLTNDLLKMIWFMRGSISYTEAFSLSFYERQCISKIIENNIELTKTSGLAII
jgi:hypothetical protein